MERLRETTLVARDGERVVGSAALLRSVAVCRDLRGRVLGQRLTRAALSLAHKRGAVRAYLLTETADAFFTRFGFAPVRRSEVPEDVRGFVEFASACPESARAMVKDRLGEFGDRDDEGAC
jgi:amino-acid N-acetyltransferase